MAAKNRVQLKKYIRFQLSQMSAQNEQHQWESAAFELARQTISSNILPATGPVQAGGDQGRDFESYRTYLGQTFGKRAWAGHGDGDVLVFACTLDKSLPSKIKNDLKSIFGAGDKPAAVYYYAEQDLPVAKRHQLQKFCLETYGARLEVFDGQAVADQLADSATFWIAEQFLSVPSEMFPPVEGDAAYTALRDRWFEGGEAPSSYADFVDVKRGLRTAAVSDEHRADLTGWLGLMRQMTVDGGDTSLERKALYELLIGQMKGRGNLDPEATAVATFFETLPAVASADELEDAAVVLSFATTAARTGSFEVEAATLRGWRDRVAAAIDKALTGAGKKTAERYVLLLSRAQLALIAMFGSSEPFNFDQGIVDWRAALEIAKENPFCDVSHFSDLIDLFVPIGGGNTKFQAFVDQFDALIAARDGAAAAGERSRNRAMALFKADQRLAAIDQLQRTKEEWFAAETMAGSVLAMILLSNAYGELHLPWAARLYAGAAQMVAMRAGDDQCKRLVGRAAFQIAVSFFEAGESLSYVAALRRALILHLELASDPNDLERHKHIVESFSHVANLRGLLVQAEPQIATKFDEILETWPVSAEDRARLIKASAAIALSPEEARAVMGQDIGQSLTNDLGAEARLAWRALGVHWAIVAQAGERLLAEQLAAVLQIIQADLGEVDLLIVPSNVELQLSRHSGPYPRIQPTPDNKRTHWTIGLPDAFEDDEAQVMIALTIVLAVLEHASALSPSELRRIVERRTERGLMNRAFWAAPPGVLLKHARSEADTGLDLQALGPATYFAPEPLEARELAWRDEPAPTYTKARAEEYIANRYRRMGPFGRIYVPQIMQDPDAAAAIRTLHDEGQKDWSILGILFNIALQREMEAMGGLDNVPGPESDKIFFALGSRVEKDGHLDHFDLTAFTPQAISVQRRIMILAVTKTWDLSISGQTPDFEAIERLLDVRFGQAGDDIEHEDFFGW